MNAHKIRCKISPFSFLMLLTVPTTIYPHTYHINIVCKQKNNNVIEKCFNVNIKLIGRFYIFAPQSSSANNGKNTKKYTNK